MKNLKSGIRKLRKLKGNTQLVEKEGQLILVPIKGDTTTWDFIYDPNNLPKLKINDKSL